MERWVLLHKGAKFEELSEKFHISKQLVSLIQKSECHRRGSDGEVSSWNDFRSV